MSGIPQSKKLWITPLSPVHMGTDEDYTPTGYVIEGNALYEFDQRALANLPKAERQTLDKLLAGKASPDMLKQVQAFFHRNREWLIPAAVNVIRVSDEMAAFYNARVGKAANVESGGRQVLNALEIERASYNPLNRRLIFPGSGLKGAIRTALLESVNGGQGTQRDERNRELQQRLFQYTMRDLNKDPMRLVQVGDCSWNGDEMINSAEVLFAVNRKKHPVVDQNGELRAAQGENLYQLLECAAPFRFRSYRGLLNIADLSELDGHQGQLPRLRFSFGEIASACNRFYRPIFEKETDLLRKRGYLDSDWLATVEHVLNNSDVQRRLDSNDAFLLRVGRHSGAESVTLNGVRSIKIMKGRGERPAWEPEAKTIWLATGSKQDKRYLRPFGWLLVEMTDLNEDPPRWSEAEERLAQYHQHMSEWLKQVKDYQNSLQEKLNTLIAAEHQRKQEEEKAAKEEVERQARWESLSEEERLIDQLGQLLEKDMEENNKQPGGPLNEVRLRLLETAMQWENTELRQQAADMIRLTVKFLPWAKKRKKEMTEKLAQLKGEI